MSFLRSLENTAPSCGLRITLAGRLTCRCPVNGRRDYARVEVAYAPTAALLELEAFGRYLASFAERALSHEETTAEIRAAIAEEVAPDDLTVTTIWEPVEGVECVVAAGG